jgi:hypothetical protein
VARSFGEIRFRLEQEIRDVALWLRPPQLNRKIGRPQPILPDPRKACRSLTPQGAANLVTLADQIVAHRFPIFQGTLDTGREIRWRRDYVNNIETGIEYFRKIRYLDRSVAGDHKIVWELNRHQHLIVLAQAYCVTGRREFLAEIEVQLQSWWEQNPFHSGMNWCSALEVAFRALSWIWVDHLVGEAIDASVRQGLILGLYQAAHHLEANLSIYFSPNTHLLGEALALHAIATIYPELPGAERWSRSMRDCLDQQLRTQFREDGSHFEQSSYYHVYALDMALFFYLLEGRPARLNAPLKAMARYLNALLGPNRLDPNLGDDDGGRFFHAYGERRKFGRATLATCALLFDLPEIGFDREDVDEQAAWWLAPSEVHPRSRPALSTTIFRGAGLAVLSGGGYEALVDVGPFGPWSGGHSHSDTLSLVVRNADEELLIDAGTYTYAGDPQWRNWFRSSQAHNTVAPNGESQAVPVNMFAWDRSPEVHVRHWTTGPEGDTLDAECRYRNYVHTRQIHRVPPFLLLIIDRISSNSPDPFEVQQFWHTALRVRSICRFCFQLGQQTTLTLASADGTIESEGGEHGWRSQALGHKNKASVVVATKRGSKQVLLGAAFDVAANGTPVFTVEEQDSGTQLRYKGSRSVSVMMKHDSTCSVSYK